MKGEVMAEEKDNVGVDDVFAEKDSVRAAANGGELSENATGSESGEPGESAVGAESVEVSREVAQSAEESGSGAKHGRK